MHNGYETQKDLNDVVMSFQMYFDTTHSMATSTKLHIESKTKKN